MKERLMKCLKGLLPPGMDPKLLCGTFLAGLSISALGSLSFWWRYGLAISRLYETVDGRRVRIPGEMMADFAALMGGADVTNALVCFWALALLMPLFIIYHYLYHRQGARSDYLMRRLPNRWVYHRRCVVLPVAAGLAALAAAMLVLLLYFGMYMLFTPGDALLPGQWMKIWSVI